MCKMEMVPVLFRLPVLVFFGAALSQRIVPTPSNITQVVRLSTLGRLNTTSTWAPAKVTATTPLIPKSTLGIVNATSSRNTTKAIPVSTVSPRNTTKEWITANLTTTQRYNVTRNVTESPEAAGCELITIPTCEGLPYNYTKFPNLLYQQSQTEAGLEVHQYYPLIEIECSPFVKSFLCALYAPICRRDYLVFPCRSLCTRSQAGCEPLMNKFGFEWRFQCEVYPENGECFDGSQVVMDDPFAPTPPAMSTTQGPECICNNTQSVTREPVMSTTAVTQFDIERYCNESFCVCNTSIPTTTQQSQTRSSVETTTADLMEICRELMTTTTTEALTTSSSDTTTSTEALTTTSRSDTTTSKDVTTFCNTYEDVCKEKNEGEQAAANTGDNSCSKNSPGELAGAVIGGFIGGVLVTIAAILLSDLIRRGKCCPSPAHQSNTAETVTKSTPVKTKVDGYTNQGYGDTTAVKANQQYESLQHPMDNVSKDGATYSRLHESHINPDLYEQVRDSQVSTRVESTLQNDNYAPIRMQPEAVSTRDGTSKVSDNLAAAHGQNQPVYLELVGENTLEQHQTSPDPTYFVLEKQDEKF